MNDGEAEAFKPRFEPMLDTEVFAKLPKWVLILYELAEEAGVAERIFNHEHDWEKVRMQGEKQAIAVETMTRGGGGG